MTKPTITSKFKLLSGIMVLFLFSTGCDQQKATASNDSNPQAISSDNKADKKSELNYFKFEPCIDCPKVQIYNYNLDSSYQHNLDTLNASYLSSNEKSRIIGGYDNSVKQKVNAFWDEAKKKSKSFDIQQQIVSSKLESNEFSQFIDEKLKIVKSKLQDDIAKLRASSDLYWTKSEYKWNRYIIAEESIELVDPAKPSEKTIKVAFPIQKFEKLRNQYAKAWREITLTMASIELRRTLVDGLREKGHSISYSDIEQNPTYQARINSFKAELKTRFPDDEYFARTLTIMKYSNTNANYLAILDDRYQFIQIYENASK